MRWLVFLLALIVGSGAIGQDVPKKKKKPAAGQAEVKAHQKPTREQIRRFNELEKKK